MKLIVRLALLSFALTCCAPALADDARSVDTAKSKARFSIGHLYVDRVTGVVPVISSKISLAKDSVVPTAIEATLDPQRIKTGEDERDSELQSPDWFDTKRFPTWQYRSTRIVADGPAKFTVEGELTVHGVSQPVTLHADVVTTSPRLAYRAVGRADRHLFGMHVTRTDALIGNDIDISLDVVLSPG